MDGVKCPGCGLINPAGFTACRRCQAPLSAAMGQSGSTSFQPGGPPQSPAAPAHSGRSAQPGALGGNKILLYIGLGFGGFFVLMLMVAALNAARHGGTGSAAASPEEQQLRDLTKALKGSQELIENMKGATRARVSPQVPGLIKYFHDDDDFLKWSADTLPPELKKAQDELKAARGSWNYGAASAQNALDFLVKSSSGKSEGGLSSTDYGEMFEKMDKKMMEELLDAANHVGNAADAGRAFKERRGIK